MPGSNGYEETAGSDVVVITAGLPRSAGHEPRRPRDDEREDRRLRHRAGRERSPDAILIVVSNPLDAMCHVAQERLGFPKERVIGMAGILDTARFRTFIAWETGASVKDVTGDGARRPRRPDGPRRLGHDRRRRPADASSSDGPHRGDGRAHAKGGGEIVKLLGTSACYAPGAAAAQMVDSICSTRSASCPAPRYLEGEYGIDGLYMGVPVKLGAGGVEEILELELTDDEQAALEESADAVREVVGVLTG